MKTTTKRVLLLGLTFLTILAVTGCSHTYFSQGISNAAGEIKVSKHGTLPDGTVVKLYTLRNNQGMEARISALGASVTYLTGPDRHQNYENVVLGHDPLRGYLLSNPYLGCIVGRYGNRIANGRFTLDGQTYTLARNNGPNALHGGIKGFDKVVWKALPRITTNGPALELRYVSQDGEEGYPGKLTVKAVYTLTRENELRLDMTATTDKPTVVNLTQHSYFNLAGKGDILSHQMFINADKFIPVSNTLIPTGELRPLDGSPLDFRVPTAIGARINQKDEQLRFANGYDHTYVVNRTNTEPALMARVYEPGTGRVLEVLSTEPGVQFYSGNFLDGTITGRGGQVFAFRNGFCLEPQHFPDSPNQPNFPSTVLRPGEVYSNTIIHRLSSR